MKRFSRLAFTLLAFVASAYAQFTFTSIDFPGGTLTTARGINNHGFLAQPDNKAKPQ